MTATEKQRVPGSGGRLFGAARRRAPGPAGVAVAVLAIGLALSGCSAAEPKVVDTYGGLPSYLPSAPAGTDGILTGSAARPALTSEGDSVKVKLPGGGTVIATVTGPDVPGEGMPNAPETTTCTWTLTLDHATKDVPLSVAQFTTFDQLGHVYRLAPAPGQAGPPAVLAAGATTTFRLRTIMQVGEGVMRWAPSGSGIVSSWDFVVEND